jgi:hypothetical protein
MAKDSSSWTGNPKSSLPLRQAEKKGLFIKRENARLISD